MDYDELLDAHLAGDDTYDDGNVDEPPPTAADLDDLDRLLFRIRLADTAEEQVTEAAKRRLDEITRWRDDTLAGIRAKQAWLQRGATGFATGHFAGLPDKVRTVKVPNGEIRRRPQRDRVLDVDDATARVIHNTVPELAPFGKPKIAKTAIAALCIPGKALAEQADEEGYIPHQAQYVVSEGPNADGEVVRETVDIPGLVIMVSEIDKVTAHPTKPKPVQETDQEDEDR